MTGKKHRYSLWAVTDSHGEDAWVQLMCNQCPRENGARPVVTYGQGVSAFYMLLAALRHNTSHHKGN